MSSAVLDRLLFLLLAALLATGVLTWRAGSADTWWLYALHGLLAGVLLAGVSVKLLRSLAPAVRHGRWRQLWIAIPLAVLTLLSLIVGFAATGMGRLVEIGPWTLLGWHALFGLLIVPFVMVHLVPKRWRLLRPRWRRSGQPSRRSGQLSRPTQGSSGGVSRRALLAGGAMGIAGMAAWGAVGVLDLLGQRPRRFTGSRWLPAGGIPIPTTFFGEGAPAIDPAAWRLRVRGAFDRPLELSLDDLHALGTADMTAVLDCTGGWVIETTWHGVPMARVLEIAGVRPTASHLEVRSVTGWGAALGLDEARGTFLATGVAGVPLPVGNGAPCRLVVPDRRGLDWVKWVSEVVVS